ncbi:LL-diaminopimelate aminotransferase [Segatella oulorum]|uniref:LL-diaminopimelate aminotransferase n=1 Tax=Segatella oulorum TaxID=28136 RepID=UPI0028E9EB3D|nr:LL-diaminopimelate aminotransferase [Segatella oulorum]
MAKVNEQFLKLPGNYLFAEVAKQVAAFKAAHPQQRVISLGIGDVTRPLCPAVINALHRATDEMGQHEKFRGYGPERGYSFLREAIIANDYVPRGIALEADEVFVNDGAKSDTGNFQELFARENSVAVTDPVYPVYIDSNAMSGRTGVFAGGKWTEVTYLPCTMENDFVPQLPTKKVDLIYLCYPNNPTGTVLSKRELQRWVEYAQQHDAIILYDAAYQAYIRNAEIPRSIYEIPGAKNVAVEFRSYSKTAGFTGVRCGYTIVPKEVSVVDRDGKRVPLNALWDRRQCTKFNGTSYISQCAAAAIYTEAGKMQVQETIDYYMENATRMRRTLQMLDYTVFGGEHAPYLWVKTPDGIDSWTFFHRLLEGAALVCTPGVGFGPSGEGYIRFTAFGDCEDCIEAMERMTAWTK